MTATGPLLDSALASLLLALRIGPALAFAPPFTLARIPVLLRVLLGLALSACVVGAGAGRFAADLAAGALLVAAARELLLGAMIVLVLQATFGAVYLAGRTLDIQAGFGLALLIDPATRAQTPLFGTLFAYAAGAVFFAAGGHLALVRIVADSLQAVPLGAYVLPSSVEGVAAFLTLTAALAFGVAAAAMLCLLIADLAVTALSRTMPQMNVLVLGLQVKAALVLIVTPLTFGVSAALLARLMSVMLGSLVGLL